MTIVELSPRQDFYPQQETPFLRMMFRPSRWMSRVPLHKCPVSGMGLYVKLLCPIHCVDQLAVQSARISVIA